MNKLNISFLNFCLHIEKRCNQNSVGHGIFPSSYKFILIS